MVTTPSAPCALMPDHWCVGFTDVDDSSHWVRKALIRLLWPPRHVVCYRDTDAGLLIVQQTLSRLLVTLQPGYTEASFTDELLSAGGRVFTVLVPPDDGIAGWVPRPFSCVDIARALVCLRYRPQTPNGLARELSRRSGNGWIEQAREKAGIGGRA